MPTSTYTPIATFTASGSQNTITFNSFSGYTDLRLVIQGNTANYNTSLRFNSDTGTNYSRTVVRGYSSTADSFRQTSQNTLSIDASVSTPGQNMTADIFNYANSTTYKTCLLRSNRATDGIDQGVGLWSSTSAITSISVLFQTGTQNYTAGTTFTLYGILAA